MQDPLAFVIAIAHIAAAIALLNGVTTTFGQAKICSNLWPDSRKLPTLSEVPCLSAWQ